MGNQEIEINEELVHRLARKVWCTNCDEDIDVCKEAICPYAVEGARDSIIEILSAVRDGKLDEALGMVGRYTAALGKMGHIPTRCSTLDGWLDEMARRGATTLIALRQEESSED